MTDSGLIAAATEALAPLTVTVARAWWDAAVDASDAHNQRREAADLALAEALGDPGLFARVRTARHEASGDEHGDASGDPGLAHRQLDVLYRTMLPHQIDAAIREEIVGLEVEVGAEFANFRPLVAGVARDQRWVDETLRSSDDSHERRTAWEASKEVGALVAPRVRRLAHLRNRAARSLGFRDHVDLSLTRDELSEPRLRATLAEVAAATDAPFAAWKARTDRVLAERFAVDALAPWHYGDAFFQEVQLDGTDLAGAFSRLDTVEAVQQTFAAMGLDIADLLARSDLLPRPGKNPHAFCADIDRSGDVRILANLAPDEIQTSTLLHESGHGAYFQEVDRGLPFLLRGMHMLCTEAVAMLFGRLSRDPQWLARHAGTEGDARSLAEAQAARLLVFSRWTLVMTEFERGLYADPDADHDTRWWDLVERFQMVQRPEGRNAPDWAAKIHISVAPVYYQHYLYGEMLASQLAATLRRRCGGIVATPGAGALLRDELFRPGDSVRWDHLVERVTGAPLGVAGLLADLQPAA